MATFEKRQVTEMVYSCYKIICTNPNNLIDEKQARNGIKLCLDRIRSVIPPLTSEWYSSAFHNFDRDGDGFIDFVSFKTIILQLYDYDVTLKNSEQSDKWTSKGGSEYASGYEESYIEQDENVYTRSQKKDNMVSGACGDNIISVDPRWKNIEKMYRTPRRAELISQIMYPTFYRFDKIFEDYEFEEITGVGSFGKVQVVKHLKTGQRRAAKVITFEGERDLRIIMKEISLMKSLDHPNIIHLGGVYYDYLTIYIILELCEGGNLFDRIISLQNGTAKKLTEKQVCLWIHQIISACAYCHKMGFVHRDIKPENILFAENSSDSPLKLIDFGLSERMTLLLDDAIPQYDRQGHFFKKFFSIFNKKSVSHRMMQRAGTPHYMAPEMIRGSYDEKCDVFGIGIVMHQLLTGIHPFYVPGMDTAESVKKKILEDELDFTLPEWKCVSSSAKKLLRELLRKSPKKRLSAADALQSCWFKEFMDGEAREQPLTQSVLEGLTQWNKHNWLKKGVLKALAQQVSVQKMSKLREKFSALDTMGKGYISADELRRAMKASNYRIDDETLEGIILAMDCSGEGLISYNQFLSSLIAGIKSYDKVEVRYVFGLLDSKGNGLVTYDDFANAASKTFSNNILKDHELKAVFNLVDRNKDGFIDFDEFHNMLVSDD